jgi:hypothetical protein
MKSEVDTDGAGLRPLTAYSLYCAGMLLLMKRIPALVTAKHHGSQFYFVSLSDVVELQGRYDAHTIPRSFPLVKGADISFPIDDKFIMGPKQLSLFSADSKTNRSAHRINETSQASTWSNMTLQVSKVPLLQSILVLVAA